MSTIENEIESHSNTGVHNQFKNWFLDYASYVILERAVPAVEDGLKPVQRRILHAMKEMDDGRFNKIANVIGQTMQYHPHGDASIGDALVNLGQKELMIETQGNWGDVRTGDAAAAPRYIEGRLSKFALEVAFNAKTTEWQMSYDGRKNEPLTLPMKFPLLLAQGVEGIAVGLSTKILPHNFCELIEAAIKHLRGKRFELYPDFQTGGQIDIAEYNQGKRGGKVKVRANIEESDKKTILIKSVPYGVTSTQIIDSIVKANDQGKIKIKKVTDNTAADVEIQVDLAPGVSSDITIDALYKFTDCEISISPNACVIVNQKPQFLTVNDLLKNSVDQTKNLLELELKIKLNELLAKWHYTSLEKIFFEEKIYKELEKKHNSWDKVIEAISEAFVPFVKQLKSEVTNEDIIKLTEKPVRRIYKLDIDELNAQIKAIESEIKQVKFDLDNLIDYSVSYFENLLKKFGKGRERKATIKSIEVIEARQVAIANVKLFINREDGFIGTGLKKDEFLFDCSDMNDIIVFTKRGTMKVVKVSEKAYIGKDIVEAILFQKNDERTTYNMIYTDGKTGKSFVKRFNVTGVTRDKEYDLTKGDEKSKVNYLSVNGNGEAELVKITLSPSCAAHKKELEFDFASLEIKGRNSMGNTLTKYPVKSVRMKEAGVSTIAGKRISYDKEFGRLNTDNKGEPLGNFNAEDKIFIIYKDGYYEVVDQELTQKLDADKLIFIEKFDASKIVTVVYVDVDKKQFIVKRFKVETTALRNKYLFIKEGNGNYLETVTTEAEPLLAVQQGRGDQLRKGKIKISKLTELSGMKAVGVRLMDFTKAVKMEWSHSSSEKNQPELF